MAIKTFTDQLTQALEHVTDIHWLTQHSPLSTPYFLGEHLLKQQNSALPAARGQVLQQLLRKSAYQIHHQAQENSDYYYRLLDLAFFRPISFRQITHELGISSATYYRHRLAAVRQLETALIKEIKPALRLEKPPRTQGRLWGREEAIANCLQKLQARKSVGITGQGGIGKTTFATHLIQYWSEDNVFWYTFRPGLKNPFTHLLFSLGYFLQSQGASSLWLQLVADSGKIDNQIALSLAQRDLETLARSAPLLCFDEVGLLHPNQVEAHALLCGFIRSLQSFTPMLLIGQQIPIEPNHLQLLTGLHTKEIAQWLQQTQIKLEAANLTQLQTYTHGNPLLLKLFITLHRSGDPFTALISRLHTAPTVEYLLNRLRERLGKEEQQLLEVLSIFRHSAPSDAWQQQAALQQLHTYHLVQIDARNGISLPPAFRLIIYNTLSPEKREAYHTIAAAIRAERSQYTAASYHYIQANQPERAIRLWHEYRTQEIGQGQGTAALELFANLSSKRLPKEESALLLILRNELRLLAGDYAHIRAELLSLSSPNHLLKSQAQSIIGDTYAEQSKFEEAITAYQKGIQATQQQDLALSRLHQKIGTTYRLKRELDSAWQEALLARYEVEHLQGDIRYYTGDYTTAFNHFQQALILAQQLQYIEGEGKTRNGLGLLLLDRGDIEAAQEQWQIASDCYQQVGRLTWVAGIKINQAIAHTQNGRFHLAIPLLQDAQAVYDSLNHKRGKATALTNLADTYLALNDLENAYRCAWASYQEDEPGLRPSNCCFLARIKLAQKEWNIAQQFCQQAIDTATENQDMFNLGYAWRILAAIHLAQNQNKAAQKAIKEAKQIFVALDLPQEVEQTDALLNT